MPYDSRCAEIIDVRATNRSTDRQVGRCTVKAVAITALCARDPR
jgi:hypothetical protein